MRMDLPGCDLHDCRYHFDGNCIKADEGKRWLWEECPHTKTFLLEEENADLKIKVEELNKSNDELSDALGRGNDILEQKVKMNITLRERLDNATDIIRKLVADVHYVEILFTFRSQAAITAKNFLKETEE